MYRHLANGLVKCLIQIAYVYTIVLILVTMLTVHCWHASFKNG